MDLLLDGSMVNRLTNYKINAYGAALLTSYIKKLHTIIPSILCGTGMAAFMRSARRSVPMMTSFNYAVQPVLPNYQPNLSIAVV